MGIGGMHLLPANADAEGVGGGHRRTGGILHCPHGREAPDVQPENGARPRVIERPFLDHEVRATLLSGWRAFFRWLENELNRAVNLVSHVAEQFGDAERDSRVRVVPAGEGATQVVRLAMHLYG